MSFERFRASIGSEIVANASGFAVKAAAGWRDCSEAFSAHLEKVGTGEIERSFLLFSSGEAAVVACFLHAMGFGALADRLLEKRGSTLLALLRHVTGDHRKACGLCILMADEAAPSQEPVGPGFRLENEPDRMGCFEKGEFERRLSRIFDSKDPTSLSDMQIEALLGLAQHCFDTLLAEYERRGLIQPQDGIPFPLPDGVEMIETILTRGPG